MPRHRPELSTCITLHFPTRADQPIRIILDTRVVRPHRPAPLASHQATFSWADLPSTSLAISLIYFHHTHTHTSLDEALQKSLQLCSNACRPRTYFEKILREGHDIKLMCITDGIIVNTKVLYWTDSSIDPGCKHPHDEV